MSIDRFVGGVLGGMGLALMALAPEPLVAQEDEERVEGLDEGRVEGGAEERYEGGMYDNGIPDDDWYYDSYLPADADAEKIVGEPWYDSGYYDGAYDEGPTGDDWYYDRYDDAGRAAMFDY